MPIRRIREYADLVRAGEGNEAERLGILEAHRQDVLDKMRELEASLERIDYKVDLYRAKLGQPALERVSGPRANPASAPARPSRGARGTRVRRCPPPPRDRWPT